MDINATLIGQMITFIIFVAFTMKFVWPPLMKILDERRKKIAEGLAAAEKGHRDLAATEHKIKQMIQDAKAEASLIVDQANQRAHQIEEQAKDEALHIIERMKKAAKAEIEEERQSLRQSLQEEAVNWAILSAEKLLHKNMDRAANEALLKKMKDDASS